MTNIQEYLTKLQRELKLRNYSLQTAKAYSICMKYYLAFIEKDPKNIEKEEIIDFLLYLQEKKKSPKTINLLHNLIDLYT